jgi:periplasmic divalent cation tolerance protein
VAELWRTYKSMDEFIQVVTTVESREQALQIASIITTARLAACAQISGPITSTYWWLGKLETADEWQLVFKTTASAYPQLESAIKENHPYEVPEILALPVLNGNPAYLSWIAAEVKPAVT